jgi:hypothetical protein
MSLSILIGKPQQLGTLTRLADGISGPQIQQAKEIFLFPRNVQPWCEAHSSFYSVDTGGKAT